MNWFKSRWKALTAAPAGGVPGFVETECNFTPRAQQVLALARREADRFHHNFVGTEHLLLGLIKLGQGVAVTVLQKLGLDLETVRLEVEKQVGMGPDRKMLGNIPYTPRVKKVLVLAAGEARALNHTYVGTEQRDQEVVVYRNALFKGTKALFPKNQYDTVSQFVELEQADGQTLFIARHSVIKFCDPGITPNSETAPGKKP